MKKDRPESTPHSHLSASPEEFPLWTRLVKLWQRDPRQPAEGADADGTAEDAPYGFATRVVASWQELRRSELVQRWERLSIRTAIGSCACAAVVGLYVMVSDQQQTAEDLIVLPPVEMEMVSGLE